MIVHCPSCFSRLDIPALRPEAGAMMVDCPVCGHDWIEGSALAVVNDAPAQPSRSGETAPAAEPDTRHMFEAARLAQQEFAAARRRRRLRAAAWAGMLGLALMPPGVALGFPEQVVSAIPASAALYGWMGREVNIYGLEIREVGLQHLVVDGKKVIAVKGELTNVSSSPRKIPSLRFGLLAKDNAEVYHWTLDTQARPLRPGESTGFVTRLASPPSAASNIEIRFARADEIGSNAAHE